jgi:hypothetical protein
MVRQELPNNTPEQVDAYLRAALQLVDDINPPGDLREAVFTAGVNLIAGKQILMAEPQPINLGAFAIPGKQR